VLPALYGSYAHVLQSTVVELSTSFRWLHGVQAGKSTLSGGRKTMWSHMCMLYNCLEWYKWVLTNLYHDRQLYNTLIPPSQESPAAGLWTCSCPWLMHCTYFTLEWIRELTLRYTTSDIHCRHRRHECDGGIWHVSCRSGEDSWTTAIRVYLFTFTPNNMTRGRLAGTVVNKKLSRCWDSTTCEPLDAAVKCKTPHFSIPRITVYFDPGWLWHAHRHKLLLGC